MTPLSANTDGSAARDPQSYAIIGAAMEVHRELGRGFLEAVYDEALAVEFGIRSISHQRQPDLIVKYKDQPLSVSYCPDFFCFETIIVEIKALAQLTTIEHSQIINYLKATGMKVGLLINFGADRLEWKRFAFSKPLPDFGAAQPEHGSG